MDMEMRCMDFFLGVQFKSCSACKMNPEPGFLGLCPSLPMNELATEEAEESLLAASE